MSETPIKKKFQHLQSFLTGSPQQFLVLQGHTYCVREGCEDCPYLGKGCQSEAENISSALIPPVRRAVGVEETPFLVLRLGDGKEFRYPDKDEVNPDLVPMSLWNTCRDPHSLDERNLHFVTSDLKHRFRVMKGQFRYYGTRTEFEGSEYAKYFVVYDEYLPQHHVVAFDFSAIEPKFSTIASRCESWVKVFNGTSKVIVREISLSDA